MQIRSKTDDALKRKYPESVALVTTRSPAGRANVMAMGWIAIASGNPPMFVLGIDGGAYTFELIRKTREFVVAFPGENMARATLFAGTHRGDRVDKFAATGLAVQKGAVVRAPLIADAVANFECKLVKIFRPGDCPLVVGRIVAAHVNSHRSLKRLYSVGPGHQLAGVRIHRARQS